MPFRTCTASIPDIVLSKSSVPQANLLKYVGMLEESLIVGSMPCPNRAKN